MKHPLLMMVMLVLAATGRSTSAEPPWYDDRKDLLWFQDDAGKLQPVQTRQDWSRRADHTRANMELVMGRLPDQSKLSLDVKTGSATRLRHYTRQHVTFTVEAGDRIPGWLLIPHGASEKDHRPAMICLPGSSSPGKNTAVGLASSADRAFAHELAERGYVCLVLDYPL